jgi:adenylate kinase family enzyme
VYRDLTQPLIDYYGGRVRSVHGIGGLDEVYDRIVASIG